MFFQWNITPQYIEKIDKKYIGAWWKKKQVAFFIICYGPIKKQNSGKIYILKCKELNISFTMKLGTMLLEILPNNIVNLTRTF